MNFVVLYGPPAVGKFTVARELAKLTGYKLFHGHLTWNMVTPIFEWGSDTYKRVLPKVRRLVFEEAARSNTNLIFTFVYSPSRGHIAETNYFQPVEKCGGKLCLVRLYANKEVTEKRVTNRSRAEAGKLNTVSALRDYHRKLPDLNQSIPNRKSLELDTGQLSPVDSARAIDAFYALS